MGTNSNSIPGFWVFVICTCGLIGAFALSWIILFTGMWLGDAITVFFP